MLEVKAILKYTVFLIGFIVLPLAGQNLVPNGNFENGDLPCDFPTTPDADLLVEWYTIYGGMRYEREECLEANSDLEYLAYSGLGYGSITGGLWVNGVASSSFFGVQLEKTLEAGQVYYFILYGRSRGISHVDEASLQDCEISPSKQVKFYIGDDNEEFGATYENGIHLRTEVKLLGDYSTIHFDKPMTVESHPSLWLKFTSCYEATGGESHIGISGPLGQVDVRSPCETITDQELDTFSADAFGINRFFQFFRYDIDNLGVYHVPDRLEAQDSICRYEYNLLDLRDHLPEIPIWGEARFEWSDGHEGPIREIDDVGKYNLDVIMDCKTIPMILTLYETECPNQVFIPNAFSPNRDGINDYFQIQFNPFYDVKEMNLQIYDRWGSQVFESSLADAHWDGLLNGIELEPGNYIWNLSYELVGFSRVEVKIGSLLLFR